MQTSKVNPLANPKGVKHVCELCGATANLQCPYCRCTYYCCKEHQKLDWEGVHSRICDMIGVIRQESFLIASERQRRQHEAHVRELMQKIIDVGRLEATKFLTTNQAELAMPPAMQALRFSQQFYGKYNLEVTPAYLLLGEVHLKLNNIDRVRDYLNLAQWQITALEERIGERQRIAELSKDQEDVQPDEDVGVGGVDRAFLASTLNRYATVRPSDIPTDISRLFDEETYQKTVPTPQFSDDEEEKDDGQNSPIEGSTEPRSDTTVDDSSGEDSQPLVEGGVTPEDFAMSADGTRRVSYIITPSTAAETEAEDMTVLDDILRGASASARTAGSIPSARIPEPAQTQPTAVDMSETLSQFSARNTLLDTTKLDDDSRRKRLELLQDPEMDGVNYLRAKIYLLYGKYMIQTKAFDNALRYLGHSAYYFSMVCGPTNVLTTSSYFLLAQCFQYMEEYSTAVVFFDQIVAIWTAYFRTCFEDAEFDAMSELGELNLTEAETILTHISNFYLDAYGELSLSSANGVYSLALFYYNIREVQLAHDSLTRSQKILESLGETAGDADLLEEVSSFLSQLSEVMDHQL